MNTTKHLATTGFIASGVGRLKFAVGVAGIATIAALFGAAPANAGQSICGVDAFGTTICGDAGGAYQHQHSSWPCDPLGFCKFSVKPHPWHQ